MARSDPTYIAEVISVAGGIVAVRLRSGIPSLIMVEGESYRVGQIGAFLRIPLGYTQLFGVCTQIGAAAAPPGQVENDEAGRRSMSMVLFGEAVGNRFERGVGQYPTVGDEVHLVRRQDLAMIYGAVDKTGTIAVGHLAAAASIPAQLDIRRLVTRHCAVVGSSGAGKSNLVAVLLDAIATQGYSSARVLVIDPHGEYASAVGNNGYVFNVKPDEKKREKALYVPFWALPFDELTRIAMGQLSPAQESPVREHIVAMKQSAAEHLAEPPPVEQITADSPVPFSVRKLWFDLDDFERQTFKESSKQDDSTRYPVDVAGDPNALRPNSYPPATPYNNAPYKNAKRRGIERQLDFLRSRLADTRYSFLFQPGDEFNPAVEGKIVTDLDGLVQSWVGHDRPITVLDVSGLPSDVLSATVGTLLRVVYDTLFWGSDLLIGGRQQPLLIVLEEAHTFLPQGGDSPAHRTIARIAKEGRKYGVGLVVVTQRPTEIDGTVLSQCGTMIALRLTNTEDRAKVQSTSSDDLGALFSLLPSLRTGEGLVIGEAVAIPSRVRFHKAGSKPHGNDPGLPEAWQQSRPDNAQYAQAIYNWRRQSTST